MKKQFLILVLFLSCYSFAQSINDYKAVIVPLKYDFLKSENQYRLSTMTKANLLKAGFEAFYANQSLPSEYNDRCSLLYVDVLQDKAFLLTKLYIVFKDCFGKVVYQSEIGKSKAKEFQLAYTEALNNAFQSVYDLNYTYAAPIKEVVQEEAKSIPVTKVVPAVPNNVEASATINKVNSDLLYAQATANGYNLIDSEPKIVMKIYKTSIKDYFTAVKGNTNGVVLLKDNQWFFEYYQNDQLVSEQVQIKF